ncbi:O-antigen ligase family protein [Phosphitispora sp. TUW77]|uniref:O-antigen ligase family protein n=1 Tax=Phosphitispora sp. TUW77 TaxID=3152361 RepID=UPI003AB30081
MYVETDRNLYRFFVAVVAFTLVFPKAGNTVNGIPLTVANMFLGILILWVISRRIRLKTPIADRVYLLYTCLILLVPWVFSAGNIIAYVKIVMPLFVSLTVYYWVKPITQALVSGRRRLDILVRVMAVSVIIIAIYGFIQKLFGHYDTIIPGLTMSFSDSVIPDIFYQKKNLVGVPGFSENVHKVTSTYQNGNLFGTILVMLMFPVTAAFLYAQDWNDKILYGTAVVLVFALVPFTLARSVLFGALVGVGIFFLMQRNKRNKIIIACLVLLMGFMILPSPFMRARMIMTFFDPSMNGRIQRMDTVSTLVSESISPLGADGNNSIIEKENVVEKMNGTGIKTENLLWLTRLFGFGFVGDETKKITSFWDLYTENMYFTTCVFTGLAGMLLFVLVIGRSLYILSKYLRNGFIRMDFLSSLAAGIFCSLVAFLCQAFIEGPLSLPPTGFVLWFLAGLGHSVVGLEFETIGFERI